MIDTQKRMLFSLFCHDVATTDAACDLFTGVFKRIDEFEDEIAFNKEIIQKDEFKPFTK